MLARPSPVHSRFLLDGVAVISSTTRAVISDSSRPTIAMASAGIAMMRRVSQFHGTSGRPAKTGRLEGSWPRSATVFSGSPRPTLSALSTRMQINGEGIALTPGSGSRGRPQMIASPSTSIAQLAVLAPASCGSWAAKIRIASALTKPVRTEEETKRSSTPIRSRPNSSCTRPASRPAANR